MTVRVYLDDVGDSLREAAVTAIVPRFRALAATGLAVYALAFGLGFLVVGR